MSPLAVLPHFAFPSALIYTTLEIRLPELCLCPALRPTKLHQLEWSFFLSQKKNYRPFPLTSASILYLTCYWRNMTPRFFSTIIHDKLAVFKASTPIILQSFSIREKLLDKLTRSPPTNAFRVKNKTLDFSALIGWYRVVVSVFTYQIWKTGVRLKM